ncbi:glycosyltransferase family 2 protein [Novosphingobium resinovorum]|uniref:glycosyltransferase family 2 protein n=1 Tax=Novosphingobium resinovorum TaxID=158500 RepID=UPI002ED029C5|nr:glycosyltransferase family 2 protein [Novosphingobium resinovorum]
MDTTSPLSILVLMVCRNRRETTLQAIERIRRQAPATHVSIALFDDASDDGTPQAVADAHPDVTIVHGDGNAFWNGGLHQLWSQVKDARVDAFLWLNDDTWLDDDAFARLQATWNDMASERGDTRFILVGATRDTDGSISYGGYDLEDTPLAFRLKAVPPLDTQLRAITTFNGNAVLVSKAAADRIGINDPAYFHNLGDVDYGLRAKKADIPVMLLPGTIGVCEGNKAKSQRGYGSPLLSVREQWRKVNTHHGLPFRSWWHFTRRHSGSYWPLHFLLPYRHLLFFWKRSMHGVNGA